MSTQKTLYRESFLCIINGKLCLAEWKAAKNGIGECPLCKGTEFKKDAWYKGYTGCVSCLEYHILTSHLEEIENQ